jgi:hypothetical protein
VSCGVAKYHRPATTPHTKPVFACGREHGAEKRCARGVCTAPPGVGNCPRERSSTSGRSAAAPRPHGAWDQGPGTKDEGGDLDAGATPRANWELLTGHLGARPRRHAVRSSTKSAARSLWACGLDVMHFTRAFSCEFSVFSCELRFVFVIVVQASNKKQRGIVHYLPVCVVALRACVYLGCVFIHWGICRCPKSCVTCYCMWQYAAGCS